MGTLRKILNPNFSKCHKGVGLEMGEMDRHKSSTRKSGLLFNVDQSVLISAHITVSYKFNVTCAVSINFLLAVEDVIQKIILLDCILHVHLSLSMGLS